MTAEGVGLIIKFAKIRQITEGLAADVYNSPIIDGVSEECLVAKSEKCPYRLTMARPQCGKCQFPETTIQTIKMEAERRMPEYNFSVTKVRPEDIAEDDHVAPYRLVGRNKKFPNLVKSAEIVAIGIEQTGPDFDADGTLIRGKFQWGLVAMKLHPLENTAKRVQMKYREETEEKNKKKKRRR